MTDTPTFCSPFPLQAPVTFDAMAHVARINKNTFYCRSMQKCVHYRLKMLKLKLVIKTMTTCEAINHLVINVATVTVRCPFFSEANSPTSAHSQPSGEYVLFKLASHLPGRLDRTGIPNFR